MNYYLLIHLLEFYSVYADVLQMKKKDNKIDTIILFQMQYGNNKIKNSFFFPFFVCSHNILI